MITTTPPQNGPTNNSKSNVDVYVVYVAGGGSCPINY